MLEGVIAADWFPDGQELAIFRRQGRRNRIEYPIGKVLRESGSPTYWARVSPDGKKLAVSYLDEGFRVAILDGADIIYISRRRPGGHACRLAES